MIDDKDAKKRANNAKWRARRKRARQVWLATQASKEADVEEVDNSGQRGQNDTVIAAPDGAGKNLDNAGDAGGVPESSEKDKKRTGKTKKRTSKAKKSEVLHNDNHTQGSNRTTVSDQGEVQVSEHEHELLETDTIAEKSEEAKKLEADNIKTAKLKARKLKIKQKKAEKIQAKKAEAARVKAAKIEAAKAESAKVKAEKAQPKKAEAARLKVEKIEAAKLEAQIAKAERIADR
jgi:hypothetical protein